MKIRINTSKGEVTFEYFAPETEEGMGYFEICKTTDDEVEGEWLFDVIARDDMSISELKDEIEKTIITMDKVYLVCLEWRTGGVTEFEIQEVCESLETAKKFFKDEKENIVKKYLEGCDDFHVEMDSEDTFTIQWGDWEEYYELEIMEKELYV